MPRPRARRFSLVSSLYGAINPSLRSFTNSINNCSTNPLQVSAKILSCGSHHNAVITQDGELYTWGSNKNYCLGHQIDENYVEYTPHPGHCGGFGSIVDRIGRGLPRSVACGKEYTLVATYPYEGPSEEVAKKLTEEYKLRQEEQKLKDEEEARRKRKDLRRLAKQKQKDDEMQFLTGKR